MTHALKNNQPNPQHTPFSQVFQQDIACSALELGIPILPMDLSRKMPFKGFPWSDRKYWIDTIDDLIAFYLKYPSPPWDPNKTEASEICRWAMLMGTNNICLDVDFQKKDGNPIGPPLLGQVKQSWLDQAGHIQKTQSTLNGKHTHHYMFKAHKRCYQLPKSRLKGTTMDIIYGKKLLILYDVLPIKDVWDNLPFIPEELFRCLINLDREVISSVVHIEEEVWKKPDGKRHDELLKPLYEGFNFNIVIPIYRSFFMAGMSGYPFNSLLTSFNCIKNNHHNKFKQLKQSLLRRCYEKGQEAKRNS